MTRRSHRDEFSRKDRAAIFDRAWDAETRVHHCENPACGAALKRGEGEVDHILPVQLGGKPTIANGRLLCSPCHKAKTALDIRMIRKSDRQRDKHTGAIRPKSSIPSRPRKTPKNYASAPLRVWNPWDLTATGKGSD
ncbi:HNH endonuclease [Enterovirga sp. CN4-39]|uniref:HNH endonuclease n=1 Tax=Enterovirga sp. CN4-39 TaxID=3400910 RepID=UPI003C0BF443